MPLSLFYFNLINITMKKLFTILTLVILLFSNCITTSNTPKIPLQKLNRTFQNDKNETHLVGLTTVNRLKQAPFNEWFSKNYDQYQVKMDKLEGLKSKLKGISVTIFMATWCGDSRREVPRFLKIMNHLQFDNNQINIVNLFLDAPKYKQSIDQEEKGLNIHRVPTFIFYKADKEIGRIVEGPMNSLEVDIAQILLGVPSRPQYRAVTAFDKLIKEKGVSHLLENKKLLAQRTRFTVKNSYELNTYGYVLLDADKKEAAVAIFAINALAFPKKPNVFDSLAEGYLAINQPNLAIENYEKVLILDKENLQAKKMLKKLKEENMEKG